MGGLLHAEQNERDGGEHGPHNSDDMHAIPRFEGKPAPHAPGKAS
jgi:hypothetical protein